MTLATKSANILVVDDELGIRESMRMILKDKYNVFTVSNALDAIKHVKDNDTKTDVILLDIRMPHVNGLDLLGMMQGTAYAIPTIMVTAFPSSQSAIRAFRNGVFDYITKPFEPSEILAVVERALSRRAKLSEKDMLVDNLKKAILKNFFATSEALLLAIDAKDSYTAGHSKRVSQLFAFVVKEFNIHPSEIEILRYGAFLHDIGKIGVSNKILTKPGTLTQKEFCAMKLHPEISFKILEPLSFLKPSLAAVRHHHERFDGKGYPDGLKEDDIPFEVAVLSVVDVYDALASDRPYRKKLSHRQALEIIVDNIGTQFVPKLTEDAVVAIDKYYRTDNSNE